MRVALILGVLLILAMNVAAVAPATELPSAPEIQFAPRQLRLVPLAVVKRTRDVTETI
jgi:hypothetical protein